MLPYRRRKEEAWAQFAQNVEGWATSADSSPYLLRDLFPVDVAAPLPASRLADPGPGVLYKTIDSANRVSIASGALTYAGATPDNFIDPGYHYDNHGVGYNRAPGRALIVKNVTFTVNTSRGFTIGWSANPSQSATVNPIGLYFAAGAGISVLVGGAVSMADLWAVATYKVALILQNSGALPLIKGGIYTDWTLLFPDNSRVNTPLYPAFDGVSSVNASIDEPIIVDFTGVFASDYGVATFRDTSVVSGDLFTGTANGIHDLDVTLEANPDADDEISLNFRRQNATNKIRFILKRNAGDTNYDVQVRVVTAGTPATPSGWTDVTNVGSVDALRVIADGQTLHFYTKSGVTWTRRGATLTNSSFQTETGLEVEAAAGNTLNAVTSYPRTSSLFVVLDDY